MFRMPISYQSDLGATMTLSFGEKLRRLRVAKGQTLQEVADAVGVSKPHVWELEKNISKNPGLELVKRLAAHFRVQISDLAGEPNDAEVRIFGREFKGMTDDQKKIILDLAEQLNKKKKDG